MVSEISDIIRDTRAYACLDCGRCTVACPISHYDPTYSPRKVVYNAVHGQDTEILRHEQLRSCLTCAMCQERCQSGVQYTELIRRLRTEAHLPAEEGQCSHGGALQSMMHIMTAPSLKQNRLRWVTRNLKTATASDTLYFVGCQPYFDVLFADLGVKTVATAQSAVKLLNRLGIVPALLPNERCCGHDLLWTGDTENFARLAEHNIREIAKTKAKRVVTTCPECFLTLKEVYPHFVGELNFEVVHLSQLLADAVAKGQLKFAPLSDKVTYHDPCRLGRLGGIYDAPRAVISAIPKIELVEMSQNRKNALCCGTQAWMNCGTVNKQIQTERLREAAATGAGMLLTFCPKCQIHLKCALNDGRLNEELDLQIQDVTVLAANSLSRQEV